MVLVLIAAMQLGAIGCCRAKAAVEGYGGSGMLGMGVHFVDTACNESRGRRREEGGFA